MGGWNVLAWLRSDPVADALIAKNRAQPIAGMERADHALMAAAGEKNRARRLAHHRAEAARLEGALRRPGPVAITKEKSA